MATVLGCDLHLAYSNGLSDHELNPIYWSFQQWPWWEEANGMLYYALYKAFWLTDDEIFAHSELYIRFPIILMAQLTLFLTYKVGNALARWAGTRKPWGLYGSFMLGVNCAFLAHSFHRRFYMLNTVMVLLATWLLLRACQKRTWASVALYALGVWGCISSMLLSSLLLVPHLVYYVGSASATRKRQALQQSLAVALASVSWFFLLSYWDVDGYSRFVYHQSDGCLGLILCLGYLGPDSVHPALPALDIQFSHGLSWDWPVRAVVLLSASALIALACHLLKNRRRFLQPTAWLCPLILVWTALFYYLFSAYVKRIDICSNYCWAFPFFCLVFGQALSVNRYLRYLMLVAIIAAVPFTHTSLLAHGCSYKDVLVTLAHQRRVHEPVVLTNAAVMRYYLQRELGEWQQGGRGCWLTMNDVESQKAVPIEVLPHQINRILELLQALHRTKPLRLWLVEDGHDISYAQQGWLSEQEQAQRLEFEFNDTYPVELYRVTMWPCATGKPIFKRPAPTPLRGHSALRFLQRCR